MTKILSAVLLVLALPLPSVAQDKEAPNRRIDETSPSNERPKPAPTDAAAKRAAALRATQAAPIPVNQRQVRLAGDADPILVEMSVVEGEARAQHALPGLLRFDLQNSPVASENFDLWLFGRGSNEKTRRQKLDIRLGALVDNAAWRNSLSDQEKAKLALAGRGDVKRLFDRVEVERLDFEKVRADFSKGRESLLRIKPLSVEMETGPFGDGSLFAKTLAKLERDRAAGSR